MSVSNETYLMAGVLLDVDRILKDCDAYKINIPRPTQGGEYGLLVDGMNGRYAIAGLALDVAYEEGFDLQEIPVLDAMTVGRVVGWLTKAGLIEYTLKNPITTILVTHFH